MGGERDGTDLRHRPLHKGGSAHRAVTKSTKLKIFHFSY